MNDRRTGGMTLMLLGVGCIFYGANRLNSFTSQLASAFGVTDTTAIAAIAAGGIIAVLGALLLARATR